MSNCKNISDEWISHIKKNYEYLEDYVESLYLPDGAFYSLINHDLA